MKKPENKLIEVYYSWLWLINLFNDLVSYKDPEVCHYYVCGFCPHELFVNTRADLGPCKKIHDEAIRKEYQVNYYGLYHHLMFLANIRKFYLIQLYGIAFTGHFLISEYDRVVKKTQNQIGLFTKLRKSQFHKLRKLRKLRIAI